MFIHTPQTWKRARKAVFFPTQLTVPRIQTIPREREQSSLLLHANGTERSCALPMFAGNRFGQILMITFLASQTSFSCSSVGLVSSAVSCVNLLKSRTAQITDRGEGWPGWKKSTYFLWGNQKRHFNEITMFWAKQALGLTTAIS